MPKPPPSVQLANRSPEEQLEQDRMHDVFLLLKHLTKREEVTIKMIIDRLYDIGSVNLINQKVRFRSLNRVTKAIARMSKPVFRVVAIHWFNRNCPQLIADWLHSQVIFEDPKKKLETSEAPTIVAAQAVPVLATEPENREIQQLRSHVRRLTRLLIGAIAVLGSTTIWLGYQQLKETTEAPQFIRFVQSPISIIND